VTNLTPFVMDGVADFPGYLLGSNAPQLYAAVRGNQLYVACQTAANGHTNDHFIFVSDQLPGPANVPAPWAKAGMISVAASKPFLSAEGGNDYIAWNNAPAGSPVAKALTTGGIMEGTLDLVQTFGLMPTVVYVAAGAYQTANGGQLWQVAPAGTGPHLEAAEFLALPTLAFKDANADGLFDRLDPDLEFRIESAHAHDGGLRFTYASVPGRTYRVVYRDTLTNSWSVLPGSVQSATGTQTTLSVTNAPGTPQRFYRVELLP
jgi:hypothetical protein